MSLVKFERLLECRRQTALFAPIIGPTSTGLTADRRRTKVRLQAKACPTDGQALSTLLAAGGAVDVPSEQAFAGLVSWSGPGKTTPLISLKEAP